MLMSYPKTRYSTVAILLHWAIAAALLFQIVLGSAMEGPRDATRFSIFQLHKSVGIAILLLTLVRIGWRIANPPPPLSKTLKPWEQTLARSTHRAFYALLLALPLSGWLIVSTSKISVPTRLFGVIGWPHIPVPDAFRRSVHEASELGHQVLVALHVAGALKHHFLDSDDELDRMIPGVKAGRWLEPRLVAIGAAAVGLFALASAYPWSANKATPMAAAAPRAPQPASPPVAIAEPQPAENETMPIVDALPVKEVVKAQTQSNEWIVQKSASTLGFSTTWSGTAVRGGFGDWRANIKFDPAALATSSVSVAINTASVTASDNQVQSALSGSDWFDTASHAQATFSAKSFSATGNNRFIAKGTLTLRGVSQPLSLPFTLTIEGDQAKMSGSATIDRIAFGVGQGDWKATTDVPASVAISIRILAKRK
jgi:cytochrome b561/polyisoprenoid-binding protein YceI